jgi:hypothetical protein
MLFTRFVAGLMDGRGFGEVMRVLTGLRSGAGMGNGMEMSLF